jgi:hypothetical protein
VRHFSATDCIELWPLFQVVSPLGRLLRIVPAARGSWQCTPAPRRTWTPPANWRMHLGTTVSCTGSLPTTGTEFIWHTLTRRPRVMCIRDSRRILTANCSVLVTNSSIPGSGTLSRSTLTIPNAQSFYAVVHQRTDGCPAFYAPPLVWGPWGINTEAPGDSSVLCSLCAYAPPDRR